jgi:hypothetical protein
MLAAGAMRLTSLRPAALDAAIEGKRSGGSDERSIAWLPCVREQLASIVRLARPATPNPQVSRETSTFHGASARGDDRKAHRWRCPLMPFDAGPMALGLCGSGALGDCLLAGVEERRSVRRGLQMLGAS